MAELIPLVFTSGWASGINPYLVVLLSGLVGRFSDVGIPEALTRTDVLVAAQGFETESAASARYSDLVLRVEREDVLDREPATRAERLAVQMLGLLEAARRTISRDL